MKLHTIRPNLHINLDSIDMIGGFRANESYLVYYKVGQSPIAINDAEYHVLLDVLSPATEATLSPHFETSSPQADPFTSFLISARALDPTASFCIEKWFYASDQEPSTQFRCYYGTPGDATYLDGPTLASMLEEIAERVNAAFAAKTASPEPAAPDLISTSLDNTAKMHEADANDIPF